jgi:cytochrome P450
METDMTESKTTLPPYPLPRPQKCPLNLAPDYEGIRSQDGLEKVTVVGGFPAWLIARYEDARAVLADNRFSADPTKPGYPTYPPASDRIGARWLTRIDPPEHDVLRGMIGTEFSARRMAALRPAIQEIVDDLVTGIVEAGQPRNLIPDFCIQVPSIVICEQLGVPHADHTFFLRTVELCFKAAYTEDETKLAVEANQEFVDYLDRLITEKSKTPTDGLLSRMIEQYVKPGALSRGDMLNLARLLVAAGFDTTANTLGLGIVLLLQHPHQLEELQQNPRLWPAAVEEILRFSTVTHAGRRRAAIEDVEVNGQLIKAGDGVVVAQDSANRDASVFPDPDQFDIHRRMRQHMTFGFGVHTCVGAPLARLELEIGLATLFRRLPGLALTQRFEDLDFRYDSQAWGVYSLPARW